MRPRVTLFIANFFFSLLSALAVYVLLPYLSTLMSVTYTSLVVAGGGLAAVIFFPLLPRIVAHHGAQRLALAFALAEMFALFALALAPGLLTSILLIVIIVALQPFLSYQLDLILEAASAEEGMTGRIRAAFLTAWNLGSFIAPLIIGVLLADSDAYGRIFIAAAAAAVPLTALFATRKLPHGEQAEPVPILDSLTCIFHNRDLAAVTYGHIILWLFYAWVALYTPVYLHTTLGIPWKELSWIFSVMLIPYILLEYPAAWVADRFIGDKYLMLAGFLTAGGALASISLLSASSSTISILSTLLISRVGAALIESMTEGHFFRRVTEKDVNSVSIFRASWPLAYVIAPIIGSIILFFGNYQLLFILTGGFIALAGATTTFFITGFREARLKTPPTECV